MNEAGFAWSMVTGGSSGTGAAVARALSRRHKFLVLVGRDPDRLAAVADDCLALGAADVRILVADLRDRAAMERHVAMLRSEAPIESLIACAGVAEGRYEDEVVESRDTSRLVLEVNLLATIDLVHLVLTDMIDRGEGAIVLVSSLAALTPLPDAPSYSAAEAGLLSFGLALRGATRGRGVRVSTICSGPVEAPTTDRHIGPRPGEIAADDVAAAVLHCLTHDRAMIALPRMIGWLARLSPMLPRFVGALVTRRMRFHLARHTPPRDLGRPRSDSEPQGDG